MIEFNPFSGLSSFSETNTDRQGIAENFDTFLTLLTTQLRNQNPLDPLDTNQFTQQLVQFAGVEQEIKQNENLENLGRLSAASAITGAVSFIGKEVTTNGTTSTLNNGSASWTVTAPSDSVDAKFIVRDTAGNEVFSENLQLSEGQYTYTWDGRRNDGTVLPRGEYSLQIQATDSNGIAIQVGTNFAGVVEAVDMNGSEPVLIVNGRELKLNEVTAIKDNVNT